MPASFIAGAAAVVLVVMFASFFNPVRSVILGEEGMRIHKLREFVSDNKLGLDADIVMQYPHTWQCIAQPSRLSFSAGVFSMSNDAPSCGGFSEGSAAMRESGFGVISTILWPCDWLLARNHADRLVLPFFVTRSEGGTSRLRSHCFPRRQRSKGFIGNR